MIIDCKTIHNQCLNELKTRMKEQFHSDTITLTIFQFGNISESSSYVRGILRDCTYVGIKTCLIKLSDNITQQEFEDLIRVCNGFSDGIILQLPIPHDISFKKAALQIHALKDIDGFNENSTFVPATARGVLMMLEHLNTDFSGKNCVIIGRSKHIGRAIAKELLDRNCTTTICHSFTEDLGSHTKNADIVISATGIPHLIGTEDILAKSILVDVGITISEGKALGDFKPECSEKADLTPVPGGMGLMTRAALITNLLDAKEKFNKWG